MKQNRARLLVPALALLALASGAVACSTGAAGPAAASPTAATPPALAPTAAEVVATSRPLAGKVVGIDPGHNGRNWAHTAYIDRLVWNGREREACDTTGTATDAGYTEPAFTYQVARYLAADLRAQGAKVVLTRPNNHGYGPCITTRAHLLNGARSNVAIDIHADGGPAAGRGFAILEPVADGPNDRVIGASARFGKDVRDAFLRTTRMPTSTYDGVHGITRRDDLAGLNLTTVPKVLIECGNMRNAHDARLLTSPAFQRRAALALDQAIVAYLRR